MRAAVLLKGSQTGLREMELVKDRNDNGDLDFIEQGKLDRLGHHRRHCAGMLRRAKTVAAAYFGKRQHRCACRRLRSRTLQGGSAELLNLFIQVVELRVRASPLPVRGNHFIKVVVAYRFAATQELIPQTHNGICQFPST